MLGSALGGVPDGPPLPGAPADASGPGMAATDDGMGVGMGMGMNMDAAVRYEESGESGIPPMYNPRTAWHGDTSRLEEHEGHGGGDPSSPRGIAAAGQGVAPSVGPHANQDFLDLDEENRVLRREVARLQQLNEARRKQLAELQARCDELEVSERDLQSRVATSSMASMGGRFGGGGGGGGGGPASTPRTGGGHNPRLVTPSPARASRASPDRMSPQVHGGEAHGSRGPNLATAQRIQRLETLAQRWQAKAIDWEERYTTLFSEISKAGSRGGSTVALVEALRAAAPPERSVADQVELERAYDAMRVELMRAKDTINTLSGKLRAERGGDPGGYAVAAGGTSRGTSVSPQRVRQFSDVGSSAVDGTSVPRGSRGSPRGHQPPAHGLCPQCAVYRLRLAETSDRLNDAETELRHRDASQHRKPAFPFLDMLPGMESLEACLNCALRGRDAAFALLEMTSQYVDSYLELLAATPRMAAVIGWRAAPRTPRSIRAGSIPIAQPPHAGVVARAAQAASQRRGGERAYGGEVLATTTSPDRAREYTHPAADEDEYTASHRKGVGVGPSAHDEWDRDVHQMPSSVEPRQVSLPSAYNGDASPVPNQPPGAAGSPDGAPAAPGDDINIALDNDGSYAYMATPGANMPPTRAGTVDAAARDESPAMEAYGAPSGGVEGLGDDDDLDDYAPDVLS